MLLSYHHHIITRCRITQQGANDLLIQYTIPYSARTTPSASPTESLLVFITVIWNGYILEIGPILITEGPQFCHQVRMIEGNTNFHNSTMGVVIQLFRSDDGDGESSSNECLVDHSVYLKDHIQVHIFQSNIDYDDDDYEYEYSDDDDDQEITSTKQPSNKGERSRNQKTDSSNLNNLSSSSFSIYPLSPSYYLLHIHSLPAGSYNIRVYYQDVYMMSFPAVIQTKIESIRFITTTSMLYRNEESAVLLEMKDSFGNLITHMPLSDIQVFIQNENQSPSPVKQVTNNGIIIRFSPTTCSVNNTFLSVCVNDGIDCFTEQLVVGMKALSGV